MAAMKKILVVLVVTLVVIGAVAWFYGSVIIGGAVQKAVEAFGPKVVQVDVRVHGVGLSLFTGDGALKGIVVGNPQGYKSPSAIKVEMIRVSIAPASLFSKKIRVRTLVIENPEITFEGALEGNNLMTIQENIRKFSGASTSKSETHLQVDELVIRGGRVNISAIPLAGKAASLPISEVRIEKIGAEGDGVTVSELSKKVVGEIAKGSLLAVVKSADQIFKGAADAAKTLGEEPEKAADDVVKGVGNLFK